LKPPAKKACICSWTIGSLGLPTEHIGRKGKLYCKCPCNSCDVW
jgi:hypothetical protein